MSICPLISERYKGVSSIPSMEFGFTSFSKMNWTNEKQPSLTATHSGSTPFDVCELISFVPFDINDFITSHAELDCSIWENLAASSATVKQIQIAVNIKIQITINAYDLYRTTVDNLQIAFKTCLIYFYCWSHFLNFVLFLENKFKFYM